MNIWYFHHYATPDLMPGLHRPFEFGKYFIKAGHKLTVFSSSFLHYCGKNMIEGKEKYILKVYDGINTIFVRTNSYDSSGIKRVKNMFLFYHRLNSVAKEYVKLNGKPDIIIASSPHPLTMMAGNKIANAFRIPCICEIRDLWPEVIFRSGRIKENRLFGKILLYGEKNIYKKASALLFLKEGDHEYIKEKKWDKDNGGPIDMFKCYYVNNGVDIALFDQRMIEHKVERFSNEKFTVIYCGTIRPLNHIDILVDVGKLLGEEYQILIFGTGSCENEIKAKIVSEHVNNVFLKGYLDNELIPGILAAGDLNILNYSSTDYNWSRGNSSNKLFEYLASGKPVVSTVKMGYDILEKYNCGASSKECEAYSIAECIRTIKNKSQLEYDNMCVNARKAAKIFDISKLASDYLSIINTVIKNKGEQEND